MNTWSGCRAVHGLPRNLKNLWSSVSMLPCAIIANESSTRAARTCLNAAFMVLLDEAGTVIDPDSRSICSIARGVSHFPLLSLSFLRYSSTRAPTWSCGSTTALDLRVFVYLSLAASFSWASMFPWSNLIVFDHERDGFVNPYPISNAGRISEPVRLFVMWTTCSTHSSGLTFGLLISLEKMLRIKPCLNFRTFLLWLVEV